MPRNAACTGDHLLFFPKKKHKKKSASHQKTKKPKGEKRTPPQKKTERGMRQITPRNHTHTITCPRAHAPPTPSVRSHGLAPRLHTHAGSATSPTGVKPTPLPHHIKHRFPPSSRVFPPTQPSAPHDTACLSTPHHTRIPYPMYPAHRSANGMLAPRVHTHHIPRALKHPHFAPPAPTPQCTCDPSHGPPHPKHTVPPCRIHPV